jgi:carbonic anhydrase
MSRIRDEVLKANAAYAKDFGKKGKLAMPPARRFAILTCMDARLDPAKFAGLAEGDAHVIRNAGGRASDDAIRSLVISYKLLGTCEWFVIHHTDCGMETFTDAVMGELLASSLETASLGRKGWRDVGQGPGSPEGAFVPWLTFKDPVADLQGQCQGRRRGRAADPQPPARGREHPDLRLHLRRQERQAGRGRRCHGPGPGAARQSRQSGAAIGLSMPVIGARLPHNRPAGSGETGRAVRIGRGPADAASRDVYSGHSSPDSRRAQPSHLRAEGHEVQYERSIRAQWMAIVIAPISGHAMTNMAMISRRSRPSDCVAGATRTPRSAPTTM